MNAQNIIKIINTINNTGLNRKVSMLPENRELLDEIFRVAKRIEPYKKTSFDTTWNIWLWTEKGTYEEYADTFVSKFTYTTIEKYFAGEAGEVNNEEMKKQWSILFPEDAVWFNLGLRENEKNKMLTLDGKLIIYTGEEQEEHMDMDPLLRWILEAERKCVDMIYEGTYSKYISEKLPYRHRSGVMTMAAYWKYVPEDKEQIFGKIDPKEWEEFLSWDRTEDQGYSRMTSNDYFSFCNHLYDVLDLKSKYPMKRNGNDKEPSSPKEYYLAYAANYCSVKSFLELDGDSAEAFDNYVQNEFWEDHTWEVSQVPDIYLYPEKIDGMYYIAVSFDHKVDDYELMIHLALELRKKGVPVIKPEYIHKKMLGDYQTAILPYGTKYDSEYEEKNDIETVENRRIPFEKINEMKGEVRWYPTPQWKLAQSEMKGLSG